MKVEKPPGVPKYIVASKQRKVNKKMNGHLTPEQQKKIKEKQRVENNRKVIRAYKLHPKASPKLLKSLDPWAWEGSSLHGREPISNLFSLEEARARRDRKGEGGERS